MTRDDIIGKHMDKVSMEPMSGCWLWTAAADKNGYGMVWDGEKMDRAHRVFYSASKGLATPEANVLHDCDNPACVNPAHLHAGTQAENMKERTQRGRSGRFIDQETADRVREMLAAGASQRATAVAFGVSQRLVWSISKGLIWNAIK